MKFRTLFAITGTVITLMGCGVALADLKMGVFPRRPVAATHQLFRPLAAKLSQELGEPVQLLVAKDFESFWQMVQNKAYDLVHFNQYHYLLSRKAHGYEVIAVNEEFGSDRIAGALSVRKDSGIDTVADLKGKTILFGGGKKAMGSYIAVTAILKAHGLEADRDYAVKFAKNPPSAVIGVFNNAAAAAGSGDVILKVGVVKKAIDTSQMKILATSDAFVQLSWAVKDDMPAEKAAKIAAVMTGLKASDPSILKSAKVTDFVAASDADYGKVREIVKYVTGEDL